jgi:hypothetical protein
LTCFSSRKTEERDMIIVGLVDRSMIAGLPAELAARPDGLLRDSGS